MRLDYVGPLGQSDAPCLFGPPQAFIALNVTNKLVLRVKQYSGALRASLGMRPLRIR